MRLDGEERGHFTGFQEKMAPFLDRVGQVNGKNGSREEYPEKDKFMTVLICGI